MKGKRSRFRMGCAAYFLKARERRMCSWVRSGALDPKYLGSEIHWYPLVP
jgi:hypothetical protein